MSATIENQIRPEINSMLSRLRGRIRQYVLVNAVARVVAVLGILFWLSFGMNWAYFKLSNLELPIWFRMTFMFLSVTGAVVFAGWLMMPMLRMMRAKALALVLERRFPELDDRLITSVEVAESRGGHETELTAHMLKRTIDDVSRTVDKLHIGDVFDQAPRRRALTLAAIMAVSVGALAVINFDAMKLWASAYIDYKDVYWDRQTTIVIKVIAQPNDREKDFLDEDGKPTNGQPGTYKHPREEELALVIEVPRRAEPVETLATRQHALAERLKKAAAKPAGPERKSAFAKLAAAQSKLLEETSNLPRESRLGTSPVTALQQAEAAIKQAAATEKPDTESAAKAIAAAAKALDELAGRLQANDWKVPERIDLDYRLAEGRGSTSVTLRRKQDGERQFLHSIGGLADDIEALYIKGGDFANRRPYRIDVVDAPHIDSIVLESDYPDYTGRDTYNEQGEPVRDRRGLKGSQTALPLETDFLLHAFGNKPLIGVRLQADINEEDVREIEVQLKPFREETAGTMQMIVTAMDGSRRTVNLPPEAAWRFRLIPQEMALAERFKELVQVVETIRQSPNPDGTISRLDRSNAAAALEQLRSLAKDSGTIADSYQKLVEELDRNPVYPRLLVERMRSTILKPLNEANGQQVPAADKLLAALAATKQGEAGALDREVEARRGVGAMLIAMNNVLNEMSDGTRFDMPFLISSHSLGRLANPEAEFSGSLPLPPDHELRIYLEDTDDIIGTKPTRLTINGTVDEPPVVETRLRGISTAITRRASIPVAGRIRDDYGIVKSHFEFLVDAGQPQPAAPAAADEEAKDDAAPAEGAAAEGAEPQWRVRQFRTDFRPEGNPLEFTLENSADDVHPAARFEVLPLELQIGQELTLTVYAEDGDDINGPHFTRGEKYRFRIVSTEELLSLLYGRELGIRRRFEQIIEEVRETKKDLELHQGRLDEADKLRAGEAGPEQRTRLEEIDDAVGNAAGRGFHQVSKNHSETQDVAQSFRELLEELTNNGVHTADQVRRIEALIVLPLDQITKNDFPAVLTTVNLFKQAHEKGADPRSEIGDSIATIDTLLLHMEKVLSEMEDLVEFHEALKDLETIIKQQSEIEKAAREKQKKEAIEKLKKLGLD